MEPSTIIGIAIAVAYFVMQALGRKRKPAPPPRTPRQQEQAPRENTELDEALSEIRRALGWPEEERQPQQTAAPTESPAPRLPTTKPRTTQPKVRKTEAQPPRTQPKIQRKVFRPGALEGLPTRRIPASTPIPASTKFPSRIARNEFDEAAAIRRDKFSESPAAQKLEQRRAVAVKLESKHLPEILERIRNPHSLRQEFLIKEILDSPLFLRRRRR